MIEVFFMIQFLLEPLETERILSLWHQPPPTKLLFLLLSLLFPFLLHSLPKSCSKHTASKIKNLVEYSYIPESAHINESYFSLLSPYHLYKRPHSFTRSI